MPAVSDTTDRISRTTGKAPLSRSEAARHASLVRWGKEQPFQARLAAIREARKQKKAKGSKGKGAGKGKAPKATPEQRKAEKDAQRAKNVTAVAEATDLGDNIAALDTFNQGGNLDSRNARPLFEAGLVETDDEGNFRISAAGRAFMTAAERGDVRGAQDAISRGKDKLSRERDIEDRKQGREQTQKEKAATRAQEKAAREQERAKAKAEREKAQKEKAKSGGDGKDKPDKAAEKQAEREQNASGVQSALERSGGRSLNKEAFGHLLSFARGDDADDATLGALADATGLLERDKSGGYRMTTEGRAYVRASESGDVRAAGDAMSRALDKITPDEDTPDAEQPPASPKANPEADVRRDRRAAGRQRRRMHVAKNEAKTMSEYLDELKAQTAQERAMFANMGTSKGGGGKKPTGGQGGLWPKGADGKRHAPGEGGGKEDAAPKHDLSTGEGRTAAVLSSVGHPVSVLPHNDANADDYHGGRDATVGRLSKLSKSDLDTLEKDTYEKWNSVMAGPARDALDRQAKRDFRTTRDYQAGLIKDARAQQKGKGKDDGDLPQDLSQMTPKQHRATVDELSKLPLAELRQRQQIVREQQKDAYDEYQRSGTSTRLERGMSNLQIRDQHLAAAIDQQVFGGGKGKAKKSMDTLPDILTDLDAIADALATDADAAIKAGARHSSSDKELIQAIYDSACNLCDLAEELGAEAAMDEEDDPDEAEPDMDEDDMTVKTVEVFSTLGDEVKAIGGDTVRGLAIRFGSEDEPDASHMRDYFTKSTAFWLDAWDKRPMLYHHAMEENTADDPVIGTWTKAAVTDEGVWLEGELSKSFKYQAAIKELVRRGALRISTDSAPHLVRRAVKNGAHEVTRWPIVCASLTPSAAEPRLSAVSLKSLTAELGLANIDDSPEVQDEESDSADGQKALDERARRLVLELDILELEETAL